MREIARRVWSEPAVAIGLIATVALIIATVATEKDWNAGTIAAVLAPLATALGVRGLARSNNHPPPANGQSLPTKPPGEGDK